MKLNPVIFFVSAGVILLFLLYGVLFTAHAATVFAAIQAFIVEYLGWFYVICVSVFLGFVVWLMFSRFGEIRLGKPDEEPDYSRFSWFAMLFSAGMGIGLLFFSVAEPLAHFGNPPGEAEAGSQQAAVESMRTTFFHWGLHAWAIYIIIAGSLAYFSFRHDLPLTIRSTLYPLLGRRIHGPIGDVVEILAIFGTLFGLATSLGIGAIQINAGLVHMGWVAESSAGTQVVLIAIITGAAIVSVTLGLDRGIKRLSEMNLILGLILMLFVFLLGPTVFLLMSYVQTIGDYLSSIVAMSFRTDAYVGQEWQGNWTMFYWGWWISWSPFVGMFIARISRGRTLREFVSGVLLVPTLLTFGWLTVFGNTALHMELEGVADLVDAETATALFELLGQFPLTTLMSGIAVVVIATYFVTSADSGSLVVDILASGGHLNPPVWQRVFWATLMGSIAAVLLWAGDLEALQTAAITTALPFSVIMLFVSWSLVRGLSRDRRMKYTAPLGVATRQEREET